MHGHCGVQCLTLDRIHSTQRGNASYFLNFQLASIALHFLRSNWPGKEPSVVPSLFPVHVFFFPL